MIYYSIFEILTKNQGGIPYVQGGIPARMLQGNVRSSRSFRSYFLTKTSVTRWKKVILQDQCHAKSATSSFLNILIIE